MWSCIACVSTRTRSCRIRITFIISCCARDAGAGGDGDDPRDSGVFYRIERMAGMADEYNLPIGNKFDLMVVASFDD